MPTTANPLPEVKRLSGAVAAALLIAHDNGFLIDRRAVAQAIDFAVDLSVALPQLVEATEIHVGPAGSIEFLITLASGGAEVRVPSGGGAFYCVTEDARGAESEHESADAAEVIGLIASVSRAA